jgi:hypothetical protein
MTLELATALVVVCQPPMVSVEAPPAAPEDVSRETAESQHGEKDGSLVRADSLRVTALLPWMVNIKRWPRP